MRRPRLLRSQLLRREIPVIALALLPVSATATPSTDRAGVVITLDVKLAKRTVDVHGAEAGGAGHSVHYWVKGTISGPGYSTTVDEAWTETLGVAPVARPRLRQYPLLPDSTVNLAYGASIVSALPTATGTCQGAVQRIGAGAVVTVGGC